MNDKEKAQTKAEGNDDRLGAIRIFIAELETHPLEPQVQGVLVHQVLTMIADELEDIRDAEQERKGEK